MVCENPEKSVVGQKLGGPALRNYPPENNFCHAKGRVNPENQRAGIVFFFLLLGVFFVLVYVSNVPRLQLVF